MFRLTTKNDKDVLVDMLAEQLRRNRPELAHWKQLTFPSIDDIIVPGGKRADMEQQMRLMREVLQKVEYFDTIEPVE